MKNHVKTLLAIMIMALLLAAAPSLAKSEPDEKDSSDGKSLPGGSDGSESSGNEKTGNSESSSTPASKNSGADEDKTSSNLKTKIAVKDGELKVEVKEGQDRLKAEAKTNNNDNGQNAEVRVKTEARGGFAGLISRLIGSIFGKGDKKASSEAANSLSSGEETARSEQTSEALQQAQGKKATTPAPGIVIDESLSSGTGYPTGPLDISLQSATLLLDRVGQVKANEIKDRQYETEFAAIPVTINGAPYTANEVKVLSNLKTKAGTGQHQGTIDVDIDVPLGSTLPAGHITLEYKGSAIVSGSMTSSGGVFKTSKMTGVFAGLVSEGTYSMTIIETGSAFGSPAIVSITTTSTV